jgi:hypothetical protein
LLLYDEYMQTDFIQDWQEDITLRDMLTPIFATFPPWDENCDYEMSSIEVYYENDQTKPLDSKDTAREKAKKKYTKVELKQTLLEVLVMPNHIIPQYPVLKIVSTDNEFRDAFLKEI